MEIEFLRLNFRRLFGVIRRCGIELFQLMFEPAHDGVGNGVFKRRVVAHVGIFDAVVKRERAIELFFLRVKFRERADELEIVWLGLQPRLVFADEPFGDILGL